MNKMIDIKRLCDVLCHHNAIIEGALEWEKSIKTMNSKA